MHFYAPLFVEDSDFAGLPEKPLGVHKTGIGTQKTGEGKTAGGIIYTDYVYIWEMIEKFDFDDGTV